LSSASRHFANFFAALLCGILRDVSLPRSKDSVQDCGATNQTDQVGPSVPIRNHAPSTHYTTRAGWTGVVVLRSRKSHVSEPPLFFIGSKSGVRGDCGKNDANSLASMKNSCQHPDEVV
jgi:hypothetical protein